jgi:hypothetical protein
LNSPCGKPPAGFAGNGSAAHHRMDDNRFIVRSLTPPQAARNALATAIQDTPSNSKKPDRSKIFFFATAQTEFLVLTA